MDVRNEIARKAYELYERSGMVPGRDLDNWLEAERQVLGEHRGERQEASFESEERIEAQGMGPEATVKRRKAVGKRAEEVETGKKPAGKAATKKRKTTQ